MYQFFDAYMGHEANAELFYYFMWSLFTGAV